MHLFVGQRAGARSAPCENNHVNATRIAAFVIVRCAARAVAIQRVCFVAALVVMRK